MSKKEKDIVTKVIIQELRSRYISLIVKQVNNSMSDEVRTGFKVLNTIHSNHARGLLMQLEYPLSARLPSSYLEFKIDSVFGIHPTPVAENPFITAYMLNPITDEISVQTMPLSSITKTGTVRKYGELADPSRINSYDEMTEHIKKLRDCLTSKEYQEFSYLAAEEMKKEFQACMNYDTAFYLPRVLPQETIRSNLSLDMEFHEEGGEYKQIYIDHTVVHKIVKNLPTSTAGIRELNHIMDNSKAVKMIKEEAFRHKIGIV